MQKHVAVKHPAFSRLLLACNQAHPLARLCFALGFFLAVFLINRDIPTLLLALAASVLLLRCKKPTWRPVFRAARLLLWLLIPILLLHLLFTPGQLIWPGSSLPFSREGLFEGVWLALHLCTLFFSAMLLSASLSSHEWAWYCLRLPWVGASLFPYVKLATPIRALASRGLADARRELRLAGGLRDMPQVLVALTGLIVELWHASATEAEAVWQSWDESIDHRPPDARPLPGMFLALGGLLLPLAVWMA